MAGEFSFSISTADGIILASSGGDESQYNLLLKSVLTFRQLDKIGRAEIGFICPSLACEEESPELNAEPFTIGTKLVVELNRENEDDQELVPVFKGIVTRSELKSYAGTAELTLTLKDHAFPLTRNCQSTVYQKKTDKAIATELVGDNYDSLSLGNLTAEIEHEQIVYFGQSDWDTLLNLAHKNACVLSVDISDEGNTLSFVNLKALEKKDTINTEQQNVLGLSVGYSGEYLYNNVSVDIWNIESQAMNGEEKTESTDLSLTIYDKSISESDAVLDTNPLSYIVDAGFSEQEGKSVSEGYLNVLATSAHKGFIEFSGDTQFNLGDLIELEKIVEGYRGPFLISAVEHSISAAGWVTRYELGINPHELDFSGASHMKRPVVNGYNSHGMGYQLQLATVADFAEDEKSQFRVPIKLIKQKSDAEPIWARVAMPEAGGGRGMIFWPEAGDEVVVGFVGNDYRTPIILGSLYSPSENTVPEGFEINEENVIRGIVTKNKMKWWFDNENELQSTELDEKNNSVFEKETGLAIAVEKDLKVTVEGEGNVTSTKAMKLVSEDTLDLQSTKDMGLTGDAAINVESGKDTAIKSGGALNQEASKGVELKAGQTVTVKGSTINLN